MTAESAVEIVQLLEQNHIDVCVDGGWAVDENDYQDVRALCERFGIAMPAEYDRFLGA